MGIYRTGIVYRGGVVYGQGLILVTPGSGPVSGGTRVEIAAFGLLDTSMDDPFDGVVVDPALWTVAVNGAGSAASESDGRLHLDVGAGAAAYARITSIATVTDTDAEVSFAVQTDVVALPPATPVELAVLSLWIDANNYAQVSRKTGGAFGDRYEVAVVVGGVTVESAYLPTSDLAGDLRVIRQGSTVYLYANDIEVLRYTAFPTTAGSIRISTGNLADPYAISTDFDSFLVHTMVVMGTEPMLDAQVLSEDRIIGTTPPGIRVGVVDLNLATAAVSFSALADAFEYLDDAAFTVMAPLNGELAITIANDPTLRNRRTGRPGFLR